MDYAYFVFIVMFATNPITIDGKYYVAGDIIEQGSGMFGAADTLEDCEYSGEILVEKLKEVGGENAKVFFDCQYLELEKYSDAQNLSPVEHE